MTLLNIQEAIERGESPWCVACSWSERDKKDRLRRQKRRKCFKTRSEAREYAKYLRKRTRKALHGWIWPTPEKYKVPIRLFHLKGFKPYWEVC